MEENKQQVLVIHGGGEFIGLSGQGLIEEFKTRDVDLDRLRPRPSWKTKLQESLGDAYDVLSPRMPNPDRPLYAEWKAWFENILSALDSELVLVGHSLGGLFLIKYFSEEKTSKRIRGLFAIAPPYIEQGGKYDASGFYVPHAFTHIGHVERIFLYHSTDDPVVPIASLEKFQTKIPSADALVLDGRKHFNGPEFPELLEGIRSLD